MTSRRHIEGLQGGSEKELTSCITHAWRASRQNGVWQITGVGVRVTEIPSGTLSRTYCIVPFEHVRYVILVIL